MLENVWKYDYTGDARTLDVHIRRLREKSNAITLSRSLSSQVGVATISRISLRTVLVCPLGKSF
jgi:hypothetical protein